MNKIQIKRSSVSGKKPVAADLLAGELAVNLQDRKMYTKTEAGAVIQVGNPETADQLAVVGTITTGGKVISGGNVDATNAVNISGAAAEINIGTGGNSSPVINMATSPTAKHTIKANGTDLELTAPRVKVVNGVLSLNPSSGKEGYIAGPLGNKMLTDDGNGHVILAASRSGVETGDVILGGKLTGHFTRNVKLASNLVNESDEVLIDALTGKIRASMLDTVFITSSGVSGSYYNKTEADSKFQTITADASRNYSKTEVDNKLLSYPTLTAAGATFLSKADATANHYTKAQSDANFYSKSQADSRFFGVANNIVTDAYVLSRTVNGLTTTDTKVLSHGYSGFYRWNASQSHKALSVHVAHSDGANGAHSRGITFDYGSASDASGRRLWTYGYNANGEMTGLSKIYTDTDKPTAAELGVLPNSGTANLNGSLVATGNVIASGEHISGNANGLRIIQGGYGSFIRNDGSSTYFMSTALNDEYGGWSGIRPFRWNNATGYVNIGNGLEVNGGVYVNGATTSTGNITTSGNLTVGGANSSNVTWTPSGGSASAFTLSNWGIASRPNVFELTDKLGWLFYTQRMPNNTVEFSINGALTVGTITANTTVGGDYGSFNYIGVGAANGLGANSICFGDNDTGFKQNGDGVLDVYANSVACFRFLPSGPETSYEFKVRNPNMSMIGDAVHFNFKDSSNTEIGLIWGYASDRHLNLRGASGRVRTNGYHEVTGNAEVNGGTLFVNNMPYLSDRGLIRGNVPGGAWSDWRNRPAGLIVDVADQASNAHNIFKVTQWGHSHRCSLDYHANQLRLHTEWGGDFIFSGNEFQAPGELQANGGSVRIDTSGNVIGAVWETGNLKQELNNIRAIANSKPNGDATAWNEAYHNSVRSVRWGAANNFGSLNQTSNQRTIDNGWFMIGLNGTGGQQNNSMNIIGGRIQVYRVESGWIDAWI